MSPTKTFALVAATSACSSHPPARADDTETSASFGGTLLEMQMLDTKHGWASGKTRHGVYQLRTEDGGKSWASISPHVVYSKKPLANFDTLGALTFQLVDATHGWAACIRSLERPTNDMDLFSTTDGGKHWQPNAFKSPVGSIMDIQFVDKAHGFIQVESGSVEGSRDRKAIYRTGDGGQTWQTASEGGPEHPTEGALPYLGFCAPMVFRDDKDGWIGGTAEGDQKGFFFHTADGGKTWQPQTFPLPQGAEFDYGNYNAPSFFGTQRMDGSIEVHFEKRESSQRTGVFYSTHDGGAHWEKTGDSPFGQDEPILTSTAFADADHGWLVAGKEIYATTDRGVTWAKINSSLPSGTTSGPASCNFAI